MARALRDAQSSTAEQQHKLFSACHKQFKQFDHRAGWMVVNDVFPFLRSNKEIKKQEVIIGLQFVLDYGFSLRSLTCALVEKFEILIFDSKGMTVLDCMSCKQIFTSITGVLADSR